MVYREVTYRGEGIRTLQRRIKEIEEREEKIFMFEIKTYEDQKK